MRLFVAIDVPEHPLIEFQKRYDVAGLKLSNSFHLTLRFFGDADPKSIIEKLKQIHFDPFIIRTDKTGFLKSVVWLGIEHSDELEDLAEKIGNSDFFPHITIARIKKPRKLKVHELNFSFKVKEFVLYNSTLTPSGAIYEPLFRGS